MTEQLGLAGFASAEPSLWRRNVGGYCYATGMSWAQDRRCLGWILESATEALERCATLVTATRAAGFGAYETWHAINLHPYQDFATASRGTPESIALFLRRCAGVAVAIGTRLPAALRREVYLDVMTAREGLRAHGHICTLYSFGSSGSFPGPDGRRRLLPFSS